MLVLIALLSAAPIHFVDESLPGVQIGAVTPFTGLPVTNYLQEDMNGDGLADLVLPDMVYLQESGRFPEDARLALPDFAHGHEADLFQGRLLVRTQSALRIYKLSNGEWTTQHEQALDWPGTPSSFAQPSPATAVATFRRFAYDIDDDGTPELLDLSADGVHVFRLKQGEYVTAGTLDVLPSVTMAPPSSQSIWPPSARRLVLPEEEMACRLLVLPGALSIVTHEKRGPDHFVFARSDVSLDVAEDGLISARAPERLLSAPVPFHVRPCHLNGDDIMDFAGGRWLISNATPLPTPIYETWASLDNGRTFHIERAPSFQHFRPQCSFLDFDSDGDLDMVTESANIFGSGIRESMNRYLTDSTLSHKIAVHRQDDGGFEEQATIQLDLEIDLGTPPVAGGAMLDRYQRGALLNLTGDFDDDGFLDLAVRHTANNLSIYLADGWQSWTPEPAQTIGIPDNAEVAVADLNGDGRADLLLRWSQIADGRPTDFSIAYYAERGRR